MVQPSVSKWKPLVFCEASDGCVGDGHYQRIVWLLSGVNSSVLLPFMHIVKVECCHNVCWRDVSGKLTMLRQQLRQTVELIR